MLKKTIWANLQRIIELFTQKIVSKFSKLWVWDPRSGIRKKAILDPGSRDQKGTGSRIQIRNTAQITCLTVDFHIVRLPESLVQLVLVEGSFHHQARSNSLAPDNRIRECVKLSLSDPAMIFSGLRIPPTMMKLNPFLGLIGIYPSPRTNFKQIQQQFSEKEHVERSVVDPGCLTRIPDPVFFSDSRISYLGSNNKRVAEKNSFFTLLLTINFTKL